MPSFFSLILACQLFAVGTGLAAGPIASVKLALNWKAEPQFGGFYEAQRSGFFRDENLNVEILEGGSGMPTVQMLANSKVDFAVVSAEEILILNDRNPKSSVIAVFASFQVNPQIIMTHADRNFGSLGEVYAASGILAQQSGLSYAQFLLKKYGSPKVRIVPYAGGIGPFLNDKNYSQQGFLTSEPIAAEKSGAKVKSFLVAHEGFNPYVTVVAVKKEFAEKNKPTVESFVKALRRGWEKYLSNPDSTNKLMAGLNKGMDLETFGKSSMAQKVMIQPTAESKIGAMTLERWNELGQQMFDLKLIKSLPKGEAQFIKF